MKLDPTMMKEVEYDTLDAYSIDPKNMDSPQDQKENEWTNPNAETYWGIFNKHGEFKNAVLMKAIWNTGKGWTAGNTRTKKILERIDGWGKETFKDILFNMDVNRYVFGDAYAEIIRDPKTYELLNLRVINPTDMKHITDKTGRLKRFELIDRQANKVKQKFRPEEIFYLPCDFIGNQGHGTSKIVGLEDAIKADQKSFEDTQQIVSHHAKPFILFKIKTDDDATVQALATKIRRLREVGNDLFVPDDENIMSWEVIQVNPSSIIMDWKNETRNTFYRQLGLPLVLFGAAGSTESGGKMETFGHEVHWEHGQKFIEEQFFNQVGLKINLISPQSLLNDLQTDQAKDAKQGFELQQNDLTAGSGR